MINYLIRRVLYAIPILVGVNVITFALFFFAKSVKMFAFDFGRAEADGRDIGHEIRSRMWPSFAIALPVFLVGMLTYITVALLMAFFRGSYIDFAGVVLCVVAMSVSGLFYIIGGQYLISKLWN